LQALTSVVQEPIVTNQFVSQFKTTLLPVEKRQIKGGISNQEPVSDSFNIQPILKQGYKEPIYTTTNSFVSDPFISPESEPVPLAEPIPKQELVDAIDDGNKEIPHSFLDSLNIKPVPKRQLKNQLDTNHSVDNQEF
jgi:hypothetical protein